MPRRWASAPGAVTLRSWAMDSEILAVLPVASADAMEAVSKLFEEWEAALSRFRPDSALSRLNRSAGRPIAVEEPLLSALRHALAAARATDGIFDPTFGRALSDLGYSGTFSAIPEYVVAATPSSQAGTWRDVRIGPGGVVTIPDGMSIDLGGIAKGMAVDAALDALKAEGVPFALISAGGDLAAFGALPNAEAWPVAVEVVAGEATVALSSGAIATSSTQKRRWQTPEGVMHHLLDPRTGRPAGGTLVRATVHAPTCEEAEVAAKTALILGLDAGSAYLERQRLAGLLSTRHTSHPIGAWPASPPERAA